MNPEHRKRLQDKDVVNALLPHINFDELAEPLVEKKVLTTAMVDDIRQSEELSERNRRLLARLPRRGPAAFDKFLDALRDTKQSTAEKILSGRTSELPLNNGDSSEDHVDLSCATGGSKVYEQSRGEIQVKMATEMKSGDRIYKMDRHPRGKCVIINNYDFQNLLETREGSQLDVQRLDVLFRALGFDVLVQQNKRKSEIKELLEGLAEEQHQKDADCFVLILMSHGDLDVFYDVQKDEMSINSIIKRFNNVNCPALYGKPKLFFIQACRGDQYDAGIPVPDTTDAALHPYMGKQVSKRATKYVPQWTDMYVAYSTIPGYVSNKNPITGSWFMHALFNVFSSMAWNTHLENMMKEVAHQLHSRAAHDGARQSPEVRLFGWTKELYFNPGLTC